MVAVNGELSAAVGVYTSSIIIHIVGLIIMTIIMVVKKVNPFCNFQPWYLYLGGVMGVLATAGNNYSFSYIGVSAILALGLLGQTITGLLIDQFGLFGMKVYKIKPIRFVPLAIMLFGALFMIRTFNIVAMTLSFSVGSALVFQRVANSKLSEKTNTTISTAYTYIIGLLGSALALLVFGGGELSMGLTLPSNWVLYIGGAVGTLTVFLSMICVSKVPAYTLSALIFVGQVFSGIILDSFLIGEVAIITLVGGIIVTLGFALDMIISKK